MEPEAIKSSLLDRYDPIEPAGPRQRFGAELADTREQSSDVAAGHYVPGHFIGGTW